MNLTSLIPKEKGKYFQKFCFTALLMFNVSVYGQQQQVRIKSDEIPLKTVFKEIENQTGLSVDYNSQDLDESRIVKKLPQESTVQKLIEILLGGTHCEATFTDGHIIIVKKRMVVDASKDVRQINGVVQDEAGLPIIGANVKVKGTLNGAITDVDGRFSLTVKPDAVLQISYIGYLTQEVPVKGKNTFNIQLKEDAHSLEEVVVVGYTTIKQKSLTGAISDIKNEEIVKSSAVTLGSTLGGKVSGISTRQYSGTPGSGSDIQIRNLGTPLFVIDGIQKDKGQFDHLDPTDIESVTVLKDAAAAIYGIQASNGVIVVTTKSGKYNSKTKLDVSFRQGWQNFTYFPEMATAAQWVEMRVEQEMNLYGKTNYTKEEYAKWQAGQESGYQTFNWKDFIVRENAPQSHFNISASGGSNKTKYYFSLSNTYQDGMFDSNDFKRYNIQSNVETEIVKGLKASMNINGRIEQYNSVATTLSWDDAYIFSEAIFRNRPTERPYVNDNPLYPADNGARGYVNTAVYTGENANPGMSENTWRVLQGNVKLTYSFPINHVLNGLSLNALGSYYYADNTFERQQKTYELYTYNSVDNTYDVTGGSQDKVKTNRFNSVEEVMMRFQMNYLRDFGKHSVSAFLAAEATKRKAPSFSIDGVPTSNVLTLMQTSEFTGLSNGYEEQARAGYLGNVNYSYDDKYILELSGRYDGSYKFARGHRWGFFPSVSLAWRISRENFWKDSSWLNWLEELKIRGSYGRMGDDNVTAFLYYDGYSAYQDSYIMEEGKMVPGFSPKGIPSTTLSWIKTSIQNIGFDYGLLGGKLAGSVDFFARSRTGIPASKNDVVLPTEVGFSLPQYNLNADKNVGWDASISYTDSYKDFNYQIGFLMNYSRLKTTEIYNPQFSNSLDYYRNNSEGRWSGGYWGYQTDGQFVSQEQIDNWPIDNDGKGNRSQRPGDIIYKDLNNDGVINSDDMRVIGYNGGLPLLTYGLNLAFSWKGFDLTMQWQGAGKYQYYREWELMKFAPGDGGSVALVYDRWHREDPFDLNSEWIPGKYPSIGSWATGENNNYDRPSDFWMSNVRYLRLKEMELGYTLPKQLVQKLGIETLRLFVNGYNLLTFDNLDFADPEIASGNGVTYPQTKLISVGFKLGI